MVLSQIKLTFKTLYMARGATSCYKGRGLIFSLGKNSCIAFF